MRILTAALLVGVSLLAPAAAALLSTPDASAQPTRRVHSIGILDASAPDPARLEWWSAFRQQLRELGYVEGQNVMFATRFANGKVERLPALAEELVRLKVDVIVTSGGFQTTQAAKLATTKIPIVMTTGADPVSLGLVTSLARPGGNITGMTSITQELSGKRFQLLREVLPRVARVAVLWHVNPASALAVRDFEAAARSARIALQALGIHRPDEFEAAFLSMERERAEALIVIVSATFFSERKRLADLALRHRLPTMHGQAEYVEAGGPHRLDLARDGVRRAEGDGLADQIVPVDLGQPLGELAEVRLQTRVRLLDAVGDHEAAEGLLVPHLGILGLRLRLRVGGRHVDLARDSPASQQQGDVGVRTAGLARRRHVCLAIGGELLLGVAAQHGVQHRPAARGRALDALLAAAHLVDGRVRLLQRLRHHARVADREEPSLVRERLRLGPRLGDDLHRLLEAVAVLLLRHVVAAELRRPVAAPEADLEPAARDDVHEGRLLGQAQRVMEGEDRRRQPDTHAPGPRGGDGGEGAGIDGEAVVDEVVLGQPDLVEAELLRPLHLLELAVHDLLVAQPRHGLEEVEGPEAHGWVWSPSRAAPA